MTRRVTPPNMQKDKLEVKRCVCIRHAAMGRETLIVIPGISVSSRVFEVGALYDEMGGLHVYAVVARPKTLRGFSIYSANPHPPSMRSSYDSPQVLYIPEPIPSVCYDAASWKPVIERAVREMRGEH